MNRISWIIVVVASVIMDGQQTKQEPNTLSRYNAAFYNAGDAVSSSVRLEIFSFNGKTFTIPLPFALGKFVYRPDGNALYCTAASSHPSPQASDRGLFRVELNPVRAIPIPGSDIFGIVSMAVSATADKIIISGVRKQAGTEEYGIFELNPATGQSRILVLNDKPKVGKLFPAQSAWSHLAVSPDGKRATAMRQRTLEVIDLATGNVSKLSPNLEIGTWSPDGKWFAAIDWKKGVTVLMDADTLVPRRTLRESDVEWSPDSRYLLGVKKGDTCGAYFGTLEAVNVETGKATRVEASSCKINRATTGWVSAEIL